MRKSLAVLVLSLFWISSLAQTQPDTAFLALARKKAVSLYEAHIRGNSGFYSGSEYRQVRRTNDQHPFYKSLDGFESTVIFDDQRYDNVWLLYDLMTDNIITEHYYSGSEITLVKSKVQRFIIDGDEFIHLWGENLRTGLPAAGFYQLAYDGPSRTVARHWVAREEKIEGNKIEIYFGYRVRYYILKDNVYHKVTSRSDVLKLFTDKKADIRNFIQQEKLKIGKKNPSAFGVVARYYDSLKAGQ